MSLDGQERPAADIPAGPPPLTLRTMAGSWDGKRIRTALQKSLHFRDLPAETLERMAGLSKIHELSDGQLAQGRRSEADFSVILSGGVQLSLTSGSGHAVAIAVFGAGSFVGVGALFGACWGDVKEYRSVGRSTVASIPGESLKRLLQEDAAFRRHCVNLLMNRLSASVSALADVLHAPLSQRLARRLLGQALSAGTADHRPVEIAVSQKLVAEMLGASRSTVSEELRRLESAGIVERGYRRLRILDMEKLKHLAGDEVAPL